MKRFVSLFLAAVTVLGSTYVYAGDNIRFVYNEEEAAVQHDAVNKNSKWFIPLDAVKLANVKIIEKSSNNSITIEALGKPGYASAWIGKTKGRINSQNITLSAAPFEENGVVYLPKDFIEDCLGMKIAYDESKKTVYIDTVKEGSITATAYLNNAPKQTTNSYTATPSNSNYINYPNTDIPNFASVTGTTLYMETADSHGKVYIYSNASQSSLDKYKSALESKGFKAVGNYQIVGIEETPELEYASPKGYNVIFRLQSGKAILQILY